jgi:hypothetical protein
MLIWKKKWERHIVALGKGVVVKMQFYSTADNRKREKIITYH